MNSGGNKSNKDKKQRQGATLEKGLRVIGKKEVSLSLRKAKAPSEGDNESQKLKRRLQKQPTSVITTETKDLQK